MDTSSGMRPNVEPIAAMVLGAGVSAAFHPVTYTKVLIQLGYEPLEPTPTTSIFGKKVLAYPSVFRYMRHIRETDGFLGLYRGLGARLAGGVVGSYVSNHVSQYLKTVHPAEQEIDEDKETVEVWKNLCKETTHEMIARCAGAIATQPFQVIMIRSMAQFVGRETKYDGFFHSITEIYDKHGILGFFAGLAPRLLGEAITIWLVNILVHIVNTYLIPENVAAKGMKSYSNAVCTMMVSQLTYPFSLVSNIMTVSNSGLAAGSPPYMPAYNNWRDCISKLRMEGEMKRGASLFWRYYKGPVIIRADGQPMPAAKAHFS